MCTQVSIGGEGQRTLDRIVKQVNIPRIYFFKIVDVNE